MMVPLTFIVVKETIDNDILLGYETATKQGILKEPVHGNEPISLLVIQPRREVRICVDMRKT